MSKLLISTNVMDPQSQQKNSENAKKEQVTPAKTNENGEEAQTGYRSGGRGYRGGRGEGRGGYRGRGGGGRDNRNNDGEEQQQQQQHYGGQGFNHSEHSHRGGYGGRGRGRGGGRGGQQYGQPRGESGDREGKFSPQDRIFDRLKQISGPQVDLSPREEAIRKYSNHCRLWIGNLPLDINEDDVKELFKTFGEFDEVYFDKTKGFAFVRMDFKANAEKARQDLHLKEYKGRQLKIRFSSPGTALKIRNLSSWVTNELLEKAFGVFGEIEKAIVITDERGRATGDGIVEYCKKPCATLALRKCQEGCFFMTTSPRPVIVEQMAVVDDNEGMSEVNVNKRNPEYMKERQSGPRFANPGSFEFEYGLKWKQLYELFDKKKEMLEKELNDEKKKLEEQIEFAKYQHETELLREQLRHREEVNQRQKVDFEQRQRDWDDHRRSEEDRQRRIEEDLSVKFRQQEEELRRRQEENRQFMAERANELMKTENAQEGYAGYQDGGGNWRRNNDYGNQEGRSGYNARNEGEMVATPDSQTFMENFGTEQSDLRGRVSSRSRWLPRGEREDYGPAKRARF